MLNINFLCFQFSHIWCVRSWISSQFFGFELVPLRAFFKPVFGTFELFGRACRSYFWGWGQAKNIFATFSCRLSNLVLEVDPYLSVSNSATFWAFFALFGPPGLFWGWGQVQRLFWKLLTQTNNFYFASIALSCLFETRMGGRAGGWVAGLIETITTSAPN